MPEGDTIHRSARTLDRALTGAVVTRAHGRASALPAVSTERLVGQRVEAVEARGKHLLIWFAPDGLALHTHLAMSGSWHLYRPGQRWARPSPQSSVVLEVPTWTAVCFSAAVCELLTARQVDRHRVLSRLGPDALDDATDLAEARRRLDARGDWTVAEALVDQRVLAGVGNVYKCEVLFLRRVHPWARVAALASHERDALLATAERLLKANVAPGAVRRTTTGPPGTVPAGQQLFVYGRARQPCRRCHAAIRVARQGRQARVTYWCPGCQAPRC